MQLRPLETGELVSGSPRGIRLGFGCASLGDVQAFAAKCRVIEAAYEAGFRHFDVAPAYGHGEAEAALATVLAGVRSQVSIVSKAGIGHPVAGGALRHLRRLAAPLKNVAPSVWRLASRKSAAMTAPAGRFGPAQIEASVAESLRRLRCDALDALLLHEVSPHDLAPELLESLDRMAKQGLVHALGTGTTVEHTVQIAALHPHRFQVLQVNHYWGARTAALPASGGTLVTHRCIRSGLPWLDDPAFRREVELHEHRRELQAACADPQRAGELLLAAALGMRQAGMVLVSTSKPERARAFVALARRTDLAPLAAALNDCLDRVAQTLHPSPG